jgi:DNA-binding transcriptional LysR family regulator
MELRHLRYFLAVGEALSFRKAAAQLRLAQPALSRQVQDLEDEIGVDLFRRSPRGVTLTAEGKLFLNEAREVLKHADESVERARALARGEYGELHVGYAQVPTVEIMPPALAAFQKAVPRVKLLLHDLPTDELVAGLHNATLELAVMAQATGQRTLGIEFEVLRTYPWCVALTAAHPFSRLKSVSLEKLATEPVIGLRRKDYSEYYRVLERVFASISAKTTHRGGMRQRQFADHGSGGRTRHRSCDHGGENLFRSDGDSAFRNAVLFFEARFEALQIYRNPRLRVFRGRPEILDRPCDWLL